MRPAPPRDKARRPAVGGLRHKAEDRWHDVEPADGEAVELDEDDVNGAHRRSEGRRSR